MIYEGTEDVAKHFMENSVHGAKAQSQSVPACQSSFNALLGADIISHVGQTTLLTERGAGQASPTRSPHGSRGTWQPGGDSYGDGAFYKHITAFISFKEQKLLVPSESLPPEETSPAKNAQKGLEGRTGRAQPASRSGRFPAHLLLT